MPPLRRPGLGTAVGVVVGLVVGVVVIGSYVAGALLAAVPAPTDPEVLWVGNLAAPFFVLPFLVVAWLGRRVGRLPLPTAAGTGGTVAVAMVGGFYGLHRVGRDPRADPGVAESLAGAYRRWLSTFVLGRPGGIPWLTIGAVAGAVAGALAWAWVTRRSVAAGVLGLAPLVVEPVARVALGGRGVPLAGAYPLSRENLLVWGSEAVLGIVALWLLVHLTRPPDPRADSGTGAVRHTRPSVDPSRGD